jgi:hypothetical protein
VKASSPLTLTFSCEGNLNSGKAAEAPGVSLNWSKDRVPGKNGRFHSRESKVEVRRTGHCRLIGADKLMQQHEGLTSVYRGQGSEKIQLVEPILRVNLLAKEWSASLPSLLFFIILALITMRG